MVEAVVQKPLNDISGLAVLRSGGFSHISPQAEEGICQVMAHLWLQTQQKHPNGVPSDPGEAFEEKLIEYTMHQIAMDKSPVYGEGFRAAYTSVVQHGLLRSLEQLRSVSSFAL